MKKVIAGLVAVGAVIALRPVATRIGHNMREHCEEMAGRCKQMMAGQSPEQSEKAGTREHRKETMAAREDRRAAAETREHPEQETPQFVGNGAAVAV